MPRRSISANRAAAHQRRQHAAMPVGTQRHFPFVGQQHLPGRNVDRRHCALGKTAARLLPPVRIVCSARNTLLCRRAWHRWSSRTAAPTRHTAAPPQPIAPTESETAMRPTPARSCTCPWAYRNPSAFPARRRREWRRFRRALAPLLPRPGLRRAKTYFLCHPAEMLPAARRAGPVPPSCLASRQRRIKRWIKAKSIEPICAASRSRCASSQFLPKPQQMPLILRQQRL